MNTIRTYVALLALAVAAVLIAAACGGSSDSGAEASASSGQTVSVSAVDGIGDVLVDDQGAALYAADQEADGMVVCSSSCTTIWEPLTLSDGAAPTAGAGLAGKVGTVARPEGARQVTFQDRPLYRFVEDPAAGTVTGNGLTDSFDGRSFTWHVVTPTGVSTSGANSDASNGRYGY